MEFLIIWTGIFGLGLFIGAGMSLIPGLDKFSEWMWK